MSNEIAKRDQNSVPVLMGITDDSSQELRMLRVDPADGRLLISNSGGSDPQIPTGTVNGSNTVFVFASTPTVIVSDNLTLEKVSSDGTVNWTGTTTVTMAVAPNFDIFGLVASVSSGGSTSPAGVLGDIQLNKPLGSFGVLGGARLDTTGNARGTTALDLQSSRGLASQVASGFAATALGLGNTASGAFSVALGYANTANKQSAIAVGQGSNALGFDSSVYGVSSVAQGDYSTSIGYQSYANNSNSTAVGYQAYASADNASAFGSNITNIVATSTDIGPDNSAKATIYYSGVEGLTGLTLPARFVMGNIFTQTALVEITNDTTEKSLFGVGVGTVGLPVNFFTVAGRKVKIILKGRLKGDGTTSFQLRSYLGANLLIDSSAILLYLPNGVSSVADYGSWTIEIDITCIADGTVYANGDFRYAFGAKGGIIWGLLMPVVPVTFSSGSSYSIDVTGQFNATTTNVDFITETGEIYVSQGDSS